MLFDALSDKCVAGLRDLIPASSVHLPLPHYLHLQNDLFLYVEWDVKLYSLAHSELVGI